MTLNEIAICIENRAKLFDSFGYGMISVKTVADELRQLAEFIRNVAPVLDFTRKIEERAASPTIPPQRKDDQ